MKLSIGITGPESSGKTTLARFLTKRLNAVTVEEYAREYLSGRSGDYTFEDLIVIARRQLELKRQKAKKAEILVCDTDALVLKIWAEEKFHKTIDFIEEELRAHPCRLYFLCSPDVPWQYDPLRENPFDRERLFKKYVEYLNLYELHYFILQGSEEEREKQALEYIRETYGDIILTK